MKIKNILLIDFEDYSIKSIKNLLESNEYNVTVARDGLDGYDKFKIEKPDLIVMEPMLPKLHGFDLRKRIAKESKEDIPFIIITKFYREEQFENEGADSFEAAAFLKKPVDPGTLLNTIEDLFFQEKKEVKEEEEEEEKEKEKEEKREEKPFPSVSKTIPDKSIQSKYKSKKSLTDEDIEKKLSEAFSFSKKTSTTRSPDKEIDKKIEDLLKMRLSDLKSDTFLKKPKIADTRRLDDIDRSKDTQEIPFKREDQDEQIIQEKTAAEKPLITGADLLPDEEDKSTEESPGSEDEFREQETPLEERQVEAVEPTKQEIDREKEEPDLEEEREDSITEEKEYQTSTEQANLESLSEDEIESPEKEDHSQEFEEALQEEKEEQKEDFDTDDKKSGQTEEPEIEYSAETQEPAVDIEESPEKSLDEKQDEKIEEETIDATSIERSETYIDSEPDKPDKSIETDEDLKAEIFGEERKTDKTEIYERLIEEPYQPKQEKEDFDEDTYLGIKVGKRKKVKEKKPAPRKSGNKAMILSIVALVVIVVSALAYFLVFKGQKTKTPPPPVNGFLLLQQQDYIDYEGLQILIDNQTTPLNLSETQEISSGAHQIHFIKDNKTYTQDIQILEETTTELAIPLYPVTISITPRGEIWEGENKLTDSAPNHTLYHLPVEYTYTFRQAGYQDVTENIYINENNLLEPVEIELPRIIPVEPGIIEVQVFPSGQVFEGNRLLATFPPLRQNISLSPGSHTLRFTTLEEGCEDQIQTYQISSGEVLTETIYLCFGFIDINSNPPGAQLIIDNNESDINGNLYGQTPRATLRLPVGPHIISLNHPDYPQKTIQVVIRKNETLNRTVDLNE